MLKFSLLENALDFTLDAVTQLEGPQPEASQIKYAILHLCSSIELLFKEKLRQEHWSLILDDVNKANREAFDRGDSRTVGFKQAKERLERICGIDFGNHAKVIDRLRRLRNRLIHFQIEVGKEEVLSILVRAWSFILDFEREHLDLTEDAGASEIFDQIRRKMAEHERFVEERKKEIEPELLKLREEGWIIIDCPICLQDALNIDGGDWFCHFCRRRSSVEEGMEEWLTLHEGWRYLDGKEQMIDPSVKECPECEMEGLYKFEDGNMTPPDPGWICLHCGQTWPWDGIRTCVRCGRPMVPAEEGDVICCFPDD